MSFDTGQVAGSLKKGEIVRFQTKALQGEEGADVSKAELAGTADGGAEGGQRAGGNSLES